MKKRGNELTKARGRGRGKEEKSKPEKTTERKEFKKLTKQLPKKIELMPSLQRKYEKNLKMKKEASVFGQFSTNVLFQILKFNLDLKHVMNFQLVSSKFYQTIADHHNLIWFCLYCLKFPAYVLI